MGLALVVAEPGRKPVSLIESSIDRLVMLTSVIPPAQFSLQYTDGILFDIVQIVQDVYELLSPPVPPSCPVIQVREGF